MMPISTLKVSRAARSLLFAIMCGLPLVAETDPAGALRARAEAGEAAAQLALGRLLADAKNPAADLPEAYVWLNLAAAAGASGEAFNSLLDRLSDAQITEGQRRLEARRALMAATGSAALPSTPFTRLAVAPEETDAAQPKLANEVAASRKEVEGLKTQLAEAQKRIAIAEVALANKDRALAAKPVLPEPTPNPTLVDGLTREVEGLKAEVNTLRLANEATVGELNHKLVALRAERDDFEKRSLASADLVRQLDVARGDVARITRDLDSTRAALEVVSAAKPVPTEITPENDPVELRKRLEESETKLGASLRTYTLTKGDLDRAEAALDEVRTQKAAEATVAEQAQAAQQAEIARLQAEATQRQTAVDQAARDLVAARDALQQSTGELELAREQIRQFQATISALSDSNRELKTRLALLAPAPGTTLVSPSRPGSVEFVQAVVNKPTLSIPEADPAPVVAEKVTRPRQHVVVSGDSLTKLARVYYGTAARWTDILEANRATIRDPNSLTVGSSLRIP